MATYAQVKAAAEAPVTSFRDSTTPEGHFSATTKILGVITTYHFLGEMDDDDAQITSRQEIHGRRFVKYRGNGLKGGALA